jgi:hypothetical protein
METFMENVVMVLTSKTAEQMFRDGGSGHWKIDASRIPDCKYLVASHRELENGTHTTFMLGRGLSAKSSEPGRFLIGFEEYALIGAHDLWPSQRRNPVAYANHEDLEKSLNKGGLSLEILNWIPFPHNEVVEENWVAPLTIREARQGLAKGLGVSSDSIEITIHA